MNKQLHNWPAIVVAAMAALIFTTASTDAANIVANGDFSSNAAGFTTFPGYLGGANPAAIDNWSNGRGGFGWLVRGTADVKDPKHVQRSGFK